MNPETTTVILGPPGTGKTTRLLNIVDGFLQEGIQPEQICFVTFTKKAAAVAIDRAVEKFQIPKDRFPNFKNLHSLAFTRLGLTRQNVMGFGNYIDIARMLGINISMGGLSDDGTFSGYQRGDRLLFAENLARAKMLTLEQVFEQELQDEHFEFTELQQLATTVKEYKENNGKMDFTDMIHEFIRVRPLPIIRKLLVDETQDLSPCQFEMIEVLASAAEETFIAGDDDQAIFRWAGADVDRLIAMPGKVEVLGVSYRVPKQVSDLANSIISRVEVRREKRWMPRDDDGEVNYVSGHEIIDMSEGTWLLLARNTNLLERYETYCTMNGFLYESQKGSAIRGPAWQAVRSWERLRAMKEVPAIEIQNIYEHMNVRERVAYGFKGKLAKIAKEAPQTLIGIQRLQQEFGLVSNAIWHEALDRLALEDKEYFLAALRRGEKMNREPRIKISTIHGAKGGEADNVVLFLDMSARTFFEMQKNLDDELRVWYVAVTRAKCKLFLVQAQTARFMDI